MWCCREPFNPLEYSAEVIALSVLDLTSSLDAQQWLYQQTLATGTGVDSNIDMVYLGLEDGRFLGYFGPSSYTYGSSDYVEITATEMWAPRALGKFIPPKDVSPAFSPAFLGSI